MFFKRCWFLLCLLLAVLWASAVSYAGTVTLRFAHTSEMGTPLGYGAEKLAELAYKYSRGELIIKVFHEGQLGSQRDQLEKLLYGVVDMAMVDSTLLAEYIPGLLAFELPFIFRNNDHAYAALDSVGLDVAREGEAWGFKTLAMMEHSQRHLCSGLLQLRDPRDLRGRYMRIRKDADYSRLMLFYMGARPQAMADADLAPAAERGNVDGQECTLAEIWETPVPAIHRYISITGHRYSAEPVLVSMAAWKKLLPSQREALRRAARDAADWQRTLSRKRNTDYLLKIHENKLGNIVLGIDRRRFEEAALPVWKLFASDLENGQELIDRIRSIP